MSAEHKNDPSVDGEIYHPGEDIGENSGETSSQTVTVTKYLENGPQSLQSISSQPIDFLTEESSSPAESNEKKVRLDNVAANRKSWLDSNKKIVSHAILASKAVYEGNNAWSHLNMQQHSFKKEMEAYEIENCHFLIAEDENLNVYLAFRGSVTEEDWKANADINPIHIEIAGKSSGKTHAGFNAKAEALPLRTILESDDLKGKQLIICGHSQGGAVSSIVYTILKSAQSGFENVLPDVRGIKNITFGAPMFGDDDLRKIIESDDAQFDLEMFHYVAENDPVPSSLYCAETVPKVIEYLRSKQFRCLLQPAICFFRQFSKRVAQLDDCIEKISSTPPERLENCYKPIGNYVFLSSSESYPDLVLGEKKDEIKKKITENWDKKYPTPKDLKTKQNAHELENYRHLLSQVVSGSETKEGKTSLFKPNLENVTFDFISENNKTDCIVKLSGKNLVKEDVLKCHLIMTSENPEKEISFFDRTKKDSNIGSPSKGNCEITVEMSEEDEKQIKKRDEGIKKELCVITALGEARFDLAECRAMSTLPACLQMAFERYVAFGKKSNLSQNMKQMKTEVEGIVSFIDKTSGGKVVETTRSDVREKIIRQLMQPLYLETEVPTSFNLIKGAFFSVGPENFHWISCGTNNGHTQLKIGNDNGTYTTQKQQNENYSKILNYITKRVRANWITNMRGENNYVEGYADFQLEKNLSQMVGCLKDSELIDKVNSTAEWACLSQKSRENLRQIISLYAKVHCIRKLLEKDVVIGLVGPQNSGKTTFLNKLCKTKEQVAVSTHTEEMITYFVYPNIYVVDYPGMHGTQQNSKLFTDHGSICNFFVIIFKNEWFVENKIWQVLLDVSKKCVGDGSIEKTLICFNQSLQNLSQLNQELKSRNASLSTVMANIASTIQNSKAGKGLDMQTSDIFFTDWELTHDDSGLTGTEKIREEIIRRLSLPSNVNFERCIKLL